MSGHPFVIGTAANGSVYSTGVTYQLDGASVTYSAYTSGYSSATTRKLIITVPASAPQLYYWCSIHSGMGGAINTNSTLGSSNFDGSIQSTVKVNLSAGFSIITYTGNGSSSGNVGTGFGSALPIDVAIVKRRDSTSDWQVGHRASGQGSNFAYHTNLNDNSALSGSAPYHMGTQNATNGDRLYLATGGLISSATYVAYCFNEVAGYSKFGSYTGNGNADGTFVYTGFRPAWVLIKMSSSNNSWVIYDNKRSPINLVDKRLRAQGSFAEDTHNGFDFLSNGFKTRNASSTSTNQSGATYIYLCFAESPFKNSRAR